MSDPQSRNEAILRSIIDGTQYTAPPRSRIEDLLLELKTAIESGDLGLKAEVVATLPASGASNTIYLVPNSGTTPNIYDEYIYVNNAWEKIGTTEIDLTQYYTKTETDDLLADKVDWESNGVLGAKNLVNIPDTTIPSSNYIVSQAPIYLPAGSYILTFDFNGTSGASQFIIEDANNVNLVSETFTVASGTNKISFTSASDGALMTYFTHAVGDYSKFMIRLATDTDTTYQPYAMTNRELTERVDKGSVSVTADGVKTVGALFDELMAMVDKNKLSESSYVMLDRDCYRWQYTGSTLNIPFTQVYVEVSNLYANTLRYTTGGSAWYLYTSTNGIQDNTNSVLTSGVIISLHY